MVTGNLNGRRLPTNKLRWLRGELVNLGGLGGLTVRCGTGSEIRVHGWLRAPANAQNGQDQELVWDPEARDPKPAIFLHERATTYRP